MFKILKHLKPIYLVLALVLIAFTVGQVLLELMLPDYLGEIVATVGAGGSAWDVTKIGLYMLAIAAAVLVTGGVIGFLSGKIASGIAATLREKVFKKIQTFSLSEMQNFSTGSLITRTTNDINKIQEVYSMVLRMAISAPIMIVGAIIKILGKSSQLSVVTAISISAMGLIFAVVFIIILPRFKRVQKLIDKINNISNESLTGIRVIRAYNAEGKEEEKFEETNTALTKNNKFVEALSSTLFPTMMLIVSVLSLAIVWYGAHLVNASLLEVENMMTFSMYAMQVFFNIVMLTMIFVMVPRSAVSAKRVNEVLNKDISITNPELTEFPESFSGRIEFKNVYFKYPEADSYVLENINLSINPGQTVAFIGSTGSGKSTLINLVPRFYDVSSGSVSVDGIDVKAYDQKKLLGQIGYVPQKGILFSGSIAENLEYGNQNADENDISDALKIASASEFVNKLEDKTEHNISQGGKNVSGGQRQRLSIARAIIRKPKIYIFDDSFSALDFKTDKEVRAALKKETTNATTLIVAQRIGTIKDADLIVVLEEGKIVGTGTHEQLLKKCKEYKEIALSQLSEKELENGK